MTRLQRITVKQKFHVISHFEGTRVISLINQVGFSGSFEESKRDVTYRNDPMKYVDKEKKKERGKKTEKKNFDDEMIYLSCAKFRSIS